MGVGSDDVLFMGVQRHCGGGLAGRGIVAWRIGMGWFFYCL